MSTLFSSARFKITSWYIGLILIICLSFSTIIYALVARQIEQQYLPYIIRYKAYQFGIALPPNIRIFDITLDDLGTFKNDLISEIEKELLESTNYAKLELRNKLLIANLIIIFLAGTSGYFLSGLTLDPIRKAMNKQNQFIADSSHELKTPITALKSSLEVNLRNPKLNQSCKQILSSNLEDVENLEKLTLYLLDIAQLQNNQILNLDNFNFDQLINKVIKKFQPLIISSKLNLSKNLKSCPIYANQQKIEQLISIFLDNAIKYSKPNGEINLSSYLNKRSIYLKIKDIGIGISPEDQKQLFNRFFRGDQSRCKTNCQGFGLGLSIAQRIVKAHHGQISFQSQINQGSTFTIKLPLKQ